MNRVLGKVGIVTGAGGAIGRAIALLLAKEGAKITLSDTDKVRGKRVAEEIKGEGGKALFVKHDVTREADWRAIIRTTLDQFGKLDILVNNAGVMLWKNIVNTSLEDWRWLMGVNLEGVFLGTKYAMEAMKPTGGGSIVNISSVAGLVGTLDTSAYHASKGGVRLFSKAAAFECSKAGYDYNIRVNSVHPGVIKTPMVEELLKDEEKMRTALSWHLVGRFGEPEDVAYGVLYLASDESKFVTGAELVIDGGWTAH